MAVRRRKEAAGRRIGKRPAVFLDRDGVMVRNVMRGGETHGPYSLDEFRLFPGAAVAVRRLHRAGYLTVVVTNQPGIAKGLIDPAAVAAMHARMRRAMPLDSVETCPHKRSDGCQCMKPKPDMLLAAARRHCIDFKRSFMVGDRESDVIAGAGVGCYTIFINRGYDACRETRPDHTVRSLPQAVRHILTSPRPL